MKATFVLTPAEARRLIAKAVVQTPEFQKAWKNAYVLLAGGTTNAFIAQECRAGPVYRRHQLCGFAVCHRTFQPQELPKRVL